MHTQPYRNDLQMNICRARSAHIWVPHDRPRVRSIEYCELYTQPDFGCVEIKENVIDNFECGTQPAGYP